MNENRSPISKDNPVFSEAPPNFPFAKPKISPLLIVLIFFLVINIPILIASHQNDILISGQGRVGLFNDYAWWALQLTSIPATILFLLWMPKGFSDVIQGLRRNQSLKFYDEDDQALSAFLSRFNRTYFHWAWIVISILAVAGFILGLSVPEQSQFQTWQTAGDFVFCYTILVWDSIFTLGMLAVIRVFISIFYFNKLFQEFKLNVRIVHPDRAGGLSPLGDFSVKIGYVIGIYGFASVAATLSESYVTTTQFSSPMLSNALLPLLAIYLVLAPVVFFAPIGTARSAMRRAKQVFLLKISDQIEVEFQNIRDLDTADAEVISLSLEKLDQLQRVHEMAEKFPVWPFNLRNVIRFFSAISSPFVLGVVSIIVDILF